jgi:uncharacterized protein
MSTFRILSLDGGGIMGAFAASALATLEEKTGKRIIDHFDLITGTSTGGIIAIALAMGKTAEENREFYRAEGPKIFPPGGFLGGWLKRLRHLFASKFSPEELREAITAVIGEAPLGAAKCRLVIPSYDVDQGRVYLFKTAHHPHFQDTDVHVPAVDVALATSAAPTYFPAHPIPGHGTFVDGGVWANCPAMVGLTEAVRFLGQDPRDVRLLSVSTTSYPFRLADTKRLGGVLNWNATLIETLIFGQEQGAVAQATCFLQERFHRITYVSQPGLYGLDNVRMAQELINIGGKVAEMREHKDVVCEHFLNGTHSKPFIPLRSGDTAAGQGGVKEGTSA